MSDIIFIVAIVAYLLASGVNIYFIYNLRKTIFKYIDKEN